MYCESCGKPLKENARFCTSCGAPVQPPVQPGQTTAQPPVQPGQTARNNPPQSPEPPKKKHGGRIALVVLIVVAVLAIAAGTFFFLSSGWEETDSEETAETAETVEVYYASEEAVDVLASTVIIACDVDGEELDGIQVVVTPDEVDEELSWTRSTLEVSDTGRFSLGTIDRIVPGTYRVSIVDPETEREYQCPPVRIVDEDSDEAENIPDTIKLVPDPDDPESAVAEQEATYSYTTQSIEVTIVHTEGDDPTTVESTWIYPQFTSSVENSALDELNEEIAEEVEETLEAAKSWTSDDTDGQCLKYAATVTYLSGSIACVRYESYSTHWGAHGGTTVTGKVYNLETGEELTPESVFGLTSSERRAAAVEALTAYLEKNPSDLHELDDLADIIDSIAANSERYYIAEEGLVVVSAEYELGSFAWGWVEVVVVAFEDESLVGTDVSSIYASGTMS